MGKDRASECRVKIFWAAKITVMNGDSFDKVARKCQIAPDLYPRAVREQMESKILALRDRVREGKLENWISQNLLQFANSKFLCSV